MLENGYEKNECETKPSASTSISETAVSWDTHPLVLGVLPYLELQIILWKIVISDKSVHRYNYHCNCHSSQMIYIVNDVEDGFLIVCIFPKRWV